MSAAPQSSIDLDPVIAALQSRVDAQMSIQWEPRAVLAKHGGYNAEGQVIAPTYEGRWQVIRFNDPDSTMSNRSWRHLTFVTPTERIAPGVAVMSDNGPYAPVGMWLVEYFEMMNAFNRKAMADMEAAMAPHNARVQQAHEAQYDGKVDEVLRRQFFDGTMEGGVSQFYPVTTDLT